MGARCRAATRDGTPCKVRVRASGQRCRFHRGQRGPEVGAWAPKRSGATAKPARGRRFAPSAGSSRSAKRAPSAKRRGSTHRPPQASRRRTPDDLTPNQRRRVETAAAFCSDVLVDGWLETVSDRANTYVTEPTWNRLLRSGRRRCRLLANLAAAVLAGKTLLHDRVGALVDWVASAFVAGPVERQFARELANKIPLPLDAKLVATARGAQLAGIMSCLVNGDDLTRCQCFIDLALNETKKQVAELLVAAMHDWIGLAAFPPKSGPLAAPRLDGRA